MVVTTHVCRGNFRSTFIASGGKNKVPRIFEFVTALPKSGSGKGMWRELQEQQARRDAEAAGA